MERSRQQLFSLSGVYGKVYALNNPLQAVLDNAFTVESDEPIYISLSMHNDAHTTTIMESVKTHPENYYACFVDYLLYNSLPH